MYGFFIHKKAHSKLIEWAFWYVKVIKPLHF